MNIKYGWGFDNNHSLFFFYVHYTVVIFCISYTNKDILPTSPMAWHTHIGSSLHGLEISVGLTRHEGLTLPQPFTANFLLDAVETHVH